ncbi:phenylalanine--tRNA ligase subunit alpha [Arcticibacterium luteifluviistationis]|uniref:Phenylalanine--tRNA ligase alpha subunit n=1 Tax=Arcticibacterium luteifluviistationis TaxID=1784714 RepID=A0A2Z4GHD5_9BACT|nr:phenylalanine--tRNA ligase subunit alpha [Arcticibacterium luteifluviistationis]AWW00843.1 phenylalanine--tRNA ligase subunit alpha [Arcticibacterium luteifluviistationis]
MLESINRILQEAEEWKLKNSDDLEKYRLKFLSKKGALNELFEEFKTVSKEKKREFGQELNKLKNSLDSKYQELQSEVVEEKGEANKFDLFLPAVGNDLGALHPLTLVKRRITEIFARMGFSSEDGPEIETDRYNFTALNFPENHPAREMQDTFFVSKGKQQSDDVLLRTHTSNVQVRLMENNKPPIRSIMIGRVYRNEAISARAHCQFHQAEGLYIDKNVSFLDLKNTLLHFAKEMFGKDTKIRLRPSYFPFTEPSAEIDISCFICKGEGCNICKKTGWVEIGGSGMVDPNVLESANIDPEEYTGFAFGMGIERIAMLKYDINDIRLFFDNDVRFLNQFQGA